MERKKKKRKEKNKGMRNEIKPNKKMGTKPLNTTVIF